MVVHLKSKYVNAYANHQVFDGIERSKNSLLDSNTKNNVVFIIHT